MANIEQSRAPGIQDQMLTVAHAEGAIAVANVAATEEIATVGYLSTEFIAAREGSWVRRDGRPVWVGCGDEGTVNEASVRRLQETDPAAMDPAEASLGVYGQMSGIAKNVLVAGVTVYGDQFFDHAGGFDGVLDRLRRFMDADTGPWAVRPAVHTDRSKEKAAFSGLHTAAEMAGVTLPDDADFCLDGLGPTGCAYNGGVGATSNLIATQPLVQEVVASDLAHVFGDAALAEPLINGHARVAERLGADFVFDRQAYAKSGMPVMVLERNGGEGDKHLPAADTGALVNLDPEVVGNAAAAGAYRLDVAGVALLVRRVFKEYDLPADVLIASQLADAVAVRAVLASHDAGGDHTPDPRRIALGVRGGTIQQALSKIAQLERQ